MIKGKNKSSEGRKVKSLFPKSNTFKFFNLEKEDGTVVKSFPKRLTCSKFLQVPIQSGRKLRLFKRRS
ncbi:hypothetical protein LEP1GSC170_3933, partial [Leptospira interrogans serovar Bataviae str. HAI135]